MALAFAVLGFYVGIALFAFLTWTGFTDWLIDKLDDIKKYRKIKKELKEKDNEIH